MSRPAAVIVLAAGQGTRMKSALPKVVHPLAGLSMIGHALRAAQGLDPENLVAVVRHQRVADRAFAQEQSGGDVAVIEALGDQRGDLTFALAGAVIVSARAGVGRHDELE